jgi:hypothetical protein
MDPVETQLEAYNAHDLDRFVACHSPGVVFRDPEGNVLLRGRDEVRSQFAALFASTPSLRAVVVARLDFGSYVLVEERVFREPEPAIRGAMIYHVSGDLIDHTVWLLAD